MNNKIKYLFVPVLMLALAANLFSKETQIQNEFNEGYKAFQAKDYNASLQKFRDVIFSKADIKLKGKAQYYLAATFDMRKDMNQALAEYGNFIEKYNLPELEALNQTAQNRVSELLSGIYNSSLGPDEMLKIIANRYAVSIEIKKQIDILEGIAGKHPDFSDMGTVYMRLGDRYLRFGKRKEAVKAYELALIKDPVKYDNAFIKKVIYFNKRILMKEKIKFVSFLFLALSFIFSLFGKPWKAISIKQLITMCGIIVAWFLVYLAALAAYYYKGIPKIDENSVMVLFEYLNRRDCSPPVFSFYWLSFFKETGIWMFFWFSTSVLVFVMFTTLGYRNIFVKRINNLAVIFINAVIINISALGLYYSIIYFDNAFYYKGYLFFRGDIETSYARYPEKFPELNMNGYNGNGDE
ncbi:MAG: hypothetical protein A2252_02335 [Elusimicrobia bacterium RIFOXYA2_FULL_39_19]|nr:MAG: hypothetical protein A2252_02335 [Elusimicrobia bacterium RIFOXYA2_FULL_39_19]